MAEPSVMARTASADAVRAITEGSAITLRHPQAIRPWQYVLDPLCGYLLLAEALYGGRKDCAGAFNFSPGPEGCKTVSDVIQSFADSYGKPLPVKVDTAQQLHEATLLILDASHARSMLGWHCNDNISTMLQYTADWYRAYYNKQKDLRKLMQKQINGWHDISARKAVVS
jgi:CDP-glucose 4,6-dehydratase